MRFIPKTLTCEIRARAMLANVRPPSSLRVGTFRPYCQQKGWAWAKEGSGLVPLFPSGSSQPQCALAQLPVAAALVLGQSLPSPPSPRPVPLHLIAFSHSASLALPGPSRLPSAGASLCPVSFGSHQRCVSLPFDSHSIVTDCHSHHHSATGPQSPWTS